MGNKFFEIFGRLALVIIIIVGIAGVAYYYGSQKNDTDKKEKEIVVAVNESVSPTSAVNQSPTKAPVAKVQIKAGATGHTLYTVSVPADWKSSKDEVNNSDSSDTLTLSKDGYSLVIHQANMGGSLYSFEDAKVDGPFAQEYKGTYVDFTGVNGEKYRRIDASSQNKPGEKNFTVVEKKTDSYQAPTTFGALSYTTPLSPASDLLDEMDDIVASLKK